MKILGDIESAAAAFVYKADDTTQLAWDDASNIRDIRCELHNRRREFLDGIRAWNTRTRQSPGNTFMALYSHMGPFGISPTQPEDENHEMANIVSWSDLAAAIPRGVGTIWLIGCMSDEITKQWEYVDGPVRNYALVTASSISWLQLLPQFTLEVGMDPIHFYKEMPDLVAQEFKKLELPDQATSFQYYQPTPNGWRRFPS